MQPETAFNSVLGAQVPLVSLDRLARWCRITAQVAGRLRNLGVFPEYSDLDGELVEGRFNLFDCIGHYISHLREAKGQATIRISPGQHRSGLRHKLKPSSYETSCCAGPWSGWMTLRLC
jgi:hypothetical protein